MNVLLTSKARVTHHFQMYLGGTSLFFLHDYIHSIIFALDAYAVATKSLRSSRKVADLSEETVAEAMDAFQEEVCFVCCFF
jgi:hypothetical protein